MDNELGLTRETAKAALKVFDEAQAKGSFDSLKRGSLARSSKFTFKMQGGAHAVTDQAIYSLQSIKAERERKAEEAAKLAAAEKMKKGSGPKKGGFAMDIMMMLDTKKVHALQLEFEKVEEGLNVDQFVVVMKRFLNESNKNDERDEYGNPPGGRGDEGEEQVLKPGEEDIVADLMELFAQIDVNGDGTMEWEEFTSFIVETGMKKADHNPNAIQMYHPSSWEDTSKHNTLIERISCELGAWGMEATGRSMGVCGEAMGAGAHIPLLRRSRSGTMNQCL